ncbi:Acetylcholinesterase like protein [Verticillium longisporum]|uniref:Carboxylic ester hydrolase n=1 Tax=Verticillium longisporum TaxID=100787 RepID=A0A8I2ZVQ0_VERLO|nr:Acetylcholinesterase like protein [Verticillium longisporum]
MKLSGLWSCALPGLAFAGLASRSAQYGPSVTLGQGTLVGITTQIAYADVKVNKFLGVPFAISPPRRFEPPEPVPSSSKTLSANQWSAKCIEHADPSILVDDAEESEDCLYLNVYVPDTPTKDKAVLFWIYGGSLKFGNAGQPAYDGSFFAAYEDVIVVAANYRTNAFGFSNSPEIDVGDNNVGFMDQRRSLDWVQRNIRAFGGDPEKVTIFGESSGASSVDRLVTSPPHPLPYRAAILQSGQASVSPAPPGNGEVSWENLVRALDCNKATSELACVRAADPFKIKTIVRNLSLPFPPINDGVTQKPTPLLKARESGEAAPVPILLGSNGLEGSLFVQPFVKQLRDLPSDTAAIGLVEEPAALVTKASVKADNPTWRYYFNATFPNTQAPLVLPEYGIDNIGAYHASEIPVVFGTYGIYDKYAPSTEEQKALSRYMLRSWASFAKNPDGGPGWTRATDRKQSTVGCLGCYENPVGVAEISSTRTDGACGLLNMVYTAREPLF